MKLFNFQLSLVLLSLGLPYLALCQQGPCSKYVSKTETIDFKRYGVNERGLFVWDTVTIRKDVIQGNGNLGYRLVNVDEYTKLLGQTPQNHVLTTVYFHFEKCDNSDREAQFRSEIDKQIKAGVDTVEATMLRRLNYYLSELNTTLLKSEEVRAIRDSLFVDIRKEIAKQKISH